MVYISIRIIKIKLLEGLEMKYVKKRNFKDLYALQYALNNLACIEKIKTVKMDHSTYHLLSISGYFK